MKWRPIETAPKDGTWILLLFEKEGAIQAKYIESDEYTCWNVIGLPSHGCGCCCEANDAPTHWCPLPTFKKESI